MKSRVFKQALNSFNAAAVELEINAATKPLPFSYDESMQLCLDAFEKLTGKVPGSIFGEIKLPGGGVSDIRATYTDPEGEVKDLRDFDPWPVLLQSTVPPSPELDELIRNTRSYVTVPKDIDGQVACLKAAVYQVDLANKHLSLSNLSNKAIRLQRILLAQALGCTHAQIGEIVRLSQGRISQILAEQRKKSEATVRYKMGKMGHVCTARVPESPEDYLQISPDLAAHLREADYSRSVPTSDGSVEAWWRGRPATFPENSYCTRSQLLNSFHPGNRPMIDGRFLVDGTWVLSYKQVLHFYGAVLRPFLKFHGMPLPKMMPVIQRYRTDMNELLEYLLTVYPPFANGAYLGKFAIPRPFKIVPHEERLSLKRV